MGLWGDGVPGVMGCGLVGSPAGQEPLQGAGAEGTPRLGSAEPRVCTEQQEEF